MRPMCDIASFEPYEEYMMQSVKDIGMRTSVVASIYDTFPKSINKELGLCIEELSGVPTINNPRS